MTPPEINHCSRTPTHSYGWALPVLLLVTPIRGADITATAVPDRPVVRLSDPVRVRLTLAGPAPLRPAADPAPDAASAAAWRVRPDGPATLTDLPDGRQQWARTVRADPDRPGNPLRLGFAPVPVYAGRGADPTVVAWPAVMVQVTTSFPDPSADQARPITGPEEPPPAPEPAGGRAGWAAGVGGALLLAGLAAGAWRLWRRRAAPAPAGAALARVAADWAAGRLPPDRLADPLAAAVRAAVGARFGLPADRLTTAELLVAGPWDAATAAEIGAILGRCDEARFAGRPPDRAAGDDLVRRATALAAGWAGPSA